MKDRKQIILIGALLAAITWLISSCAYRADMPANPQQVTSTPPLAESSSPTSAEPAALVPFYFFERLGKIGVVYDSQEIPLRYDTIPHNNCCSAGSLNPKKYENMVRFFALRDDTWRYVEISVLE